MNAPVGFIRVPLSVGGFAAVAAGFEKEYPGCTVGESERAEVKFGELIYSVTLIPVFASPSSPLSL